MAEAEERVETETAAEDSFNMENAHLIEALKSAGHHPYTRPTANTGPYGNLMPGPTTRFSVWCAKCDMPYLPGFHRIAGISSEKPCEGGESRTER
jgi:hypothetical protein